MQVDHAWLCQQFPDLCNLAPLGSGGQKVVYSANHTTDGEIVLKLIKPTLAVDEVDREILAVQSVQSARVPRIIAKGSIPSPFGDLLWLREARIVGQTLRNQLCNGSLLETDVLRLGQQMLEALAQAESVDIVHRDVKPDNIMVDGQGNYWLLDFGLARHLALDSLTATMALWGKFTPGYAPPEQFRNDKPSIDGRADLFALGVTLHECFCGVNSFREGARDAHEIIQRVERNRLPPLSLGLRTALKTNDFVMALTQKRRDQRPPNVRYALDWFNSICQAEHP